MIKKYGPALLLALQGCQDTSDQQGCQPGGAQFAVPRQPVYLPQANDTSSQSTEDGLWCPEPVACLCDADQTHNEPSKCPDLPDVTAEACPACEEPDVRCSDCPVCDVPDTSTTCPVCEAPDTSVQSCQEVQQPAPTDTTPPSCTPPGTGQPFPVLVGASEYRGVISLEDVVGSRHTVLVSATFAGEVRVQVLDEIGCPVGGSKGIPYGWLVALPQGGYANWEWPIIPGTLNMKVTEYALNGAVVTSYPVSWPANFVLQIGGEVLGFKDTTYTTRSGILTKFNVPPCSNGYSSEGVCIKSTAWPCSQLSAAQLGPDTLVFGGGAPNPPYITTTPCISWFNMAAGTHVDLQVVASFSPGTKRYPSLGASASVYSARDGSAGVVSQWHTEAPNGQPLWHAAYARLSAQGAWYGKTADLGDGVLIKYGAGTTAKDGVLLARGGLKGFLVGDSCLSDQDCDDNNDATYGYCTMHGCDYLW